MKQVSAIFLALAVLNPLCCCWSLADTSSSLMDHSSAHACCAEENGNSGQKSPSHDSSTCEHELIKHSVLIVDHSILVPELSWTWMANPVEGWEQAGLEVRSEQKAASIYKSDLSIPNWVSIQTDCVRRL